MLTVHDHDDGVTKSFLFDQKVVVQTQTMPGGRLDTKFTDVPLGQFVPGWFPCEQAVEHWFSAQS